MTPPIELAVFDLAGTTVADDSGVGQCLLDAAREYEVPATLEQIMRYLGTNKIHLYQFLIAQAAGRDVQIEDFDDTRQVDETYAQAKQMYDRFTELMIEYYRRGVKEIPGAADTFRWCHDHGIKVATNTGFHRDVTEALMDGLGWVRDGLVDLAVTVEDIPGDLGRPSPFMIFHAMMMLNVQSVRSVIKIGDTASDMLEGTNAGCRAVIGVLTGTRDLNTWSHYPHTHIISSVADLPSLIESGMIV
jgi:phosphonatase-like hydrolase